MKFGREDTVCTVFLKRLLRTSVSAMAKITAMGDARILSPLNTSVFFSAFIASFVEVNMAMKYFSPTKLVSVSGFPGWYSKNA